MYICVQVHTQLCMGLIDLVVCVQYIQCVLHNVYVCVCASVCQVSQWPLSDKGLLYDREWLVLAENGVTLSQKQDPRLCTILPSIDLEGGTLTLSAPGEGCGLVRCGGMRV